VILGKTLTAVALAAALVAAAAAVAAAAYIERRGYLGLREEHGGLRWVKVSWIGCLKQLEIVCRRLEIFKMNVTR